MKDKLFNHIKKVIKRDGLDTDSREQQYHYRRIFLYALLRKHGYSLTNSGKLFNRHHATIINGLKVYDAIRKDAVFLEYVESYRVEFEPYLHYTLKPDDHNLAAQVLRCVDFWQMVELQEKIKSGFFNKVKQVAKV